MVPCLQLHALYLGYRILGEINIMAFFPVPPPYYWLTLTLFLEDVILINGPQFTSLPTQIKV